jgi:hypothetical protein
MKTLGKFRRNFASMNPTPLCKKVLCATLLLSAVFVLSLSGLPRRASAQVIFDSLHCSTPSVKTVEIGGVLFGGSVQDTVRFLNAFTIPNDSVFTFEFAGDASFSVDIDSFHLHPDSQALWTFNYKPTDSSNHFAYLIIRTRGSDSTCIDTLLINAPAITPTKDSATFSIFPSPQDVIAIQSSTNISSLTIYLKNETTSQYIIDTIRLVGFDTSMSISSHIPFPDTLVASDSFQLSLTFNRTSKGFENGHLVITVPDEPILQDAIAVQGLRLPDAFVDFMPSGSVYFWLYPNPSQGVVTLHSEGLVHMHVKLLNVLGITLRDEDFNQDWTLSTISAAIPEPGTYFVVVSGITPDGMSVHEVKRLVILH